MKRNLRLKRGAESGAPRQRLFVSDAVARRSDAAIRWRRLRDWSARAALVLGAVASSSAVTNAAVSNLPELPLTQTAIPALAMPPLPTTARPAMNNTGRTINLTVPFKDGAYYVGDIIVSISPQDRVEFETQRVLGLLATLMDAKALESLTTRFAGRPVVTPEDFAGTGVSLAYQPQTLELVADIRPDLKLRRAVSITELDREQLGRFAVPAHYSGYLNVRGNLDYIHQGVDEGFADPVFFLDGAARARNVAFESEAVWQPGGDQEFQRLGSRFVYDDTHRIVRWTVGDLLPVGRGFQSAPDMAGVSFFRSYGVLQPQRVARPRGDQSFTLARTSTVEIYINGQLVRRLRLDPGSYNLRDFPFTQGANDIVVGIEDDTGTRQTLRFNVFFDRTQLERGLSEFGFYTGVQSQLRPDGPDYSKDWTVTGFYRTGVTDSLTLGSNVQFDEHVRVGGMEGVWGTRLGTLGFDVALSDVGGLGGKAATLTFQRLFQKNGSQASSLNLFYQTRSRWFGSLGVTTPDNRFEYEAGAAYSRTINARLYAALDARFSKGRDAAPDLASYRASVGWRATPAVGFTFDTFYEDSPGRHNLALLVSMTARLSAFSSLRADYDTKDDRARVSYQALHGQGVGSYNVVADVERTPDTTGFNASASYIANRAELGAAHYSTFDGTFGSSLDERTSLRLATSVAFADGSVSMGRPIYDSFAIVKPYATLKGQNIVVNPTPFGYTSSTGKLGTALETNLTAYTERTATVDAPGAPAGYDLGSGSFRMFPPYRGGYKLEVGSAYSVTAIGRLLGADGAPVPLLAGKAYEVAQPDREPLVIFTNREGRFGASGLRPGKWRIVMPTAPETTYILEVPDHTIGAIRVGDLLPSRTGS